MSQGFLTTEEVKQYLDVDQKDVDKLIRSKKLTAYKLGGSYLRFSKEQVVALRNSRKKHQIVKPGFWSRTVDFWRYNGFYLFFATLLLAILYFTLQ